VSDERKRTILNRYNEPAKSSFEGAGPLMLFTLAPLAIWVGATVLAANHIMPIGLFWVIVWGDLAALVVGVLWLENRRWKHVGLYSGVLHHYWCGLCGYRWRRVEGRPEPEQPTGRTNTDLIQRGARHLGEAARAYEEQRRRERERRNIT
jgi:hypothetical protein